MPEKGAFKIFNSGLVIFSKYPIRNELYIPFEGLTGRDSLYSKGILNCTIQKINIINTCLQYGDTTKNKKSRTNNIDQLLKSIKHYINPNFVFSGQFNISYESLEFNKLQTELGLKKLVGIGKRENYILVLNESRLKQVSYNELVITKDEISSAHFPFVSSINYPVELAEDLHHLK
jgi:hypothetical protein